MNNKVKKSFFLLALVAVSSVFTAGCSSNSAPGVVSGTPTDMKANTPPFANYPQKSTAPNPGIAAREAYEKDPAHFKLPPQPPRGDQ